MSHIIILRYTTVTWHGLAVLFIIIYADATLTLPHYVDTAPFVVLPLRSNFSFAFCAPSTMSDNTHNTRLSKKLAKGDTPSVAMLRRLKAQDELTIKNDSGDSDVFHPGDWLVQVLCAVSTSFCFC